VTSLLVVAYLCRCSSSESISIPTSPPHTTEGSLVDQDGYNPTRTSLTLLHLILQAYEYSVLIAFHYRLLVVLVRASLHLAVAPPWLTGLVAEQKTLLPHFVHPLGSPPTCLLFSRASASPLTNTTLPRPSPTGASWSFRTTSTLAPLSLSSTSFTQLHPTHP
jgi:hypothetical protein